MRLGRIAAATLAAALLAALAPAPAWAHNSLVEAVPGKDATLSKAPTQVRLRFLQKLDDRYLTIVVTDAGKRKVPTSAPEADGKAGTVTFPEPLPNGTYTVAFRVVSQDGHPVQGAYAFTVNAAQPSSSPSPSPSPSVASSAAVRPVALEQDEGPRWWPAIAVGGGIALVGALAAVAFRRRRS